MTLILAAAITAADRAEAQARIVGVVRELRSGLPVEGVTVELLQRGLISNRTAGSTRTDSIGTFRLSVAAGNYRIRLRRIGYEETVSAPIAVADSGIELEFHLKQIAVTIDAVAVKARVGGDEFEQRRRAGVGRILTAADLVERQAVDVTQGLLTVPGIHLVQERNKPPSVRTRSARTSGCKYPTYFLNGVRVGADERSEQEIRGISLLDVVALEIYQGPAETPHRFSGGGAGWCGVIVVWTHRPPL